MKTAFFSLGIIGITASIILLNRFNADPSVGNHIYWLGVVGVVVGVVGFIGYAVERRKK